MGFMSWERGESMAKEERYEEVEQRKLEHHGHPLGIKAKIKGPRDQVQTSHHDSDTAQERVAFVFSTYQGWCFDVPCQKRLWSIKTGVPARITG